jgi:hypothetical protein
MQPSAIRWYSLIVLCLMFAGQLYAQSAASAAIVGVVTDSQGAVVPNAAVTATNIATGISYSTKTTSSGNFVIPNLPPATYDVKVEAASFVPHIAKAVKLNVGDQRDLNFKLGAAGTAQIVEVTAETPLLESTKTEVSTSVTDLDMERLPTISGAGGIANDYAQLALTVPGVKSDFSGVSNPVGAGDLIGPGSINNRGNLYNVDGGNITDQVVSARFGGVGASVDEIQEFQVKTNNYNAEYGQAGGLIINAVTKSGTNSIHGDAHMYFRGRNLTASDPFYKLNLFQNALPRGTAGPPGTPYCPKRDFVGTTLVSVDGCDRAPFQRHEGGFTIGGPFIKDRFFWFGSYEISHQSAPLTLTPPGAVQTVQQPVNNLLYSGKLDFKLNNSNTLSARFNIDRQFFDNLVTQTSNNITPDVLTIQSNHSSGLNLSWISSITPNLVNEARFFHYRTKNTLPDKTIVPGVQHPNFLSGADFCCPQGAFDRRFQYMDNLTWSRGSHTFKTGFNISYYPWFSLFQQFHFGQYVVNAANAPQSFTFAVGPGQVTSKDNIYGFYFQDTWKVTRNFTLNYGLRYDYEAGAFKGGVIHGPNGTCFEGNGFISACSSDGNNFQPRLGFTYALGEKTLVKASFAESSVPAFNNVVLDSLNFDGVTLNTITTTNPAVLAAYPNAPSPALLASVVPPGNGFFGRVRPISSHLRNPEVRSVNFGVQHEFTKTLSAEIQYLGEFGFGLFGERDVNAPVVAADPAHPGFFYFQNQAPVNPALAVSARPDNRFTAIRTNENTRTSHYNGLLVSATKRFSNHVQFNASYTWSHALTSGEDFFGLSEPGDPRNIRAELGPAFNDIRHAANFGVVLDSGKATENRFAGWFINDLGLNFVGQLQSGRPYPVSTGSAGYADARFFGAGNETQQRPRVLADGTITTAGIASFTGSNALFGPGGVASCIAAGFPAASCSSIQNTFLAPASASGLGAVDALTGDIVDFQFLNGNVGRDAGRGSPLYRVDMSLHKSFKIPNTEHVSVELRADAINVFNHPNYQSFNSNDVTAALGFSLTATGAPASDFFTCSVCMRPNGTIVGSGGQVLHLSTLQHGKVSPDLLKPIFGPALAGIGDPASTDFVPRIFQLSFHVRF